MSEIKAVGKLREQAEREPLALTYILNDIADEIEAEIAEVREITRKKHQTERVYWHNELHKILDTINGQERFWGDCMDYPLPEATIPPSEVAKRMLSERYMLLPVDADGVPIRVGDVVAAQDEQPFEVRAFQLDALGWFAIERLGSQWNVNQLHHVKPRTLEDVLNELEGLRGYGNSTYEDVVTRAAELADEIRELLGSDAE